MTYNPSITGVPGTTAYGGIKFNNSVSGGTANFMDVWASGVSAMHVDSSGYLFYDKVWWDDSFSPPISFTTGPGAPALSALTGGLQLPAFQPTTTDDTGYFTIQLPHSISLSSNIEFHIHVTHTSAAGADASAVFRLTYTYAQINGTLFTPVTADKVLVIASGDSPLKHYYLDWGEISGMQTGGQYTGISTVFLGRLQRLANTCATEDTFGGGIYLLGADIHFQRNTPGSRGETSK